MPASKARTDPDPHRLLHDTTRTSREWGFQRVRTHSQGLTIETQAQWMEFRTTSTVRPDLEKRLERG
jgi:hypothetical protein